MTDLELAVTIGTLPGEVRRVVKLVQCRIIVPYFFGDDQKAPDRHCGADALEHGQPVRGLDELQNEVADDRVRTRELCGPHVGAHERCS